MSLAYRLRPADWTLFCRVAKARVIERKSQA
jgi:hypothetical protein